MSPNLWIYNSAKVSKYWHTYLAIYCNVSVFFVCIYCICSPSFDLSEKSRSASSDSYLNKHQVVPYICVKLKTRGAYPSYPSGIHILLSNFVAIILRYLLIPSAFLPKCEHDPRSKRITVQSLEYAFPLLRTKFTNVLGSRFRTLGWPVIV